MVVAIAVVLVAALVARQSTTREVTRSLAIVGGVALGVRLLAVTVVYFIAIQTHGEGTWLSDEAAFLHSAEWLMTNPLDQDLPQGLGHLGGNGYLGVATAIFVATGRVDTVALRVANATLGALVALMASIVAARFVSQRAALVAGLVVGVWPTLVLWSATFLRDTLTSFVVVAVWWTLASHRRVTQPRVFAVVALALVLLTSLRPYLAGAVALGVIAWAVVPVLAGRSRRFLALAAVALVVLCGGVARLEARHIDEGAHELLYRQTTTRMETLGRLYYDLSPDSPPQEPPFGPGAPVALVDPASGWLLTGLVEKTIGPGLVGVGFTDGSARTERIVDLVRLQSAPLNPLQMVLNLGPGLVSFITGWSGGGDLGSLAWSADAVAWDVLFLLALVGGVRARVPFREWLFPGVVVLGTVAALVAVPGSPGNDDRHRSPQAVPLLAVFAVGLLGARRLAGPIAGRPVSKATSSPSSAPTLAASRTRSLR